MRAPFPRKAKQHSEFDYHIADITDRRHTLFGFIDCAGSVCLVQRMAVNAMEGMQKSSERRSWPPWYVTTSLSHVEKHII